MAAITTNATGSASPGRHTQPSSHSGPGPPAGKVVTIMGAPPVGHVMPDTKQISSLELAEQVPETTRNSFLGG